MSVIKTFFITILLGTLFCEIQSQQVDDQGSKQFIDHPDKNEYLLSQPGTDKHKYGYELKENKHFHHTTTELDGVRLGCYGYVLDSKKYSTQYVADVKGYRPVYTYDAIEVYPKSGGTREASFVRNFDEETDKSGNLRYFFPEGCRGFHSLITPEENQMTPAVFPTINRVNLTPPPRERSPPPTRLVTNPPVTNPPVKIQPPATPQPPSIPTSPQPPSPPSPATHKTIITKPPKVPEKYLPPPQNTIAPNTAAPTRGKYVTKAIPSRPVQPKITAPVRSKPTTVAVPNSNNCDLGNCESQPITIEMSVPDNECAGCCLDEESMPKIVIPIKLKNGNGKSGSCSSYAKLILPADNVNVNSLKSNPTELAKMVLKSLA